MCNYISACITQSEFKIVHKGAPCNDKKFSTGQIRSIAALLVIRLDSDSVSNRFSKTNITQYMKVKQSEVMKLILVWNELYFIWVFPHLLFCKWWTWLLWNMSEITTWLLFVWNPSLWRPLFHIDLYTSRIMLKLRRHRKQIHTK